MEKTFSTVGLEYVGNGAFSTAYKQENGRILLKTADIPKSAMADRLFPNHRLFPEVNEVGFEGSKTLYDMPFYKQPTWENVEKSLSPRQYRLYQALEAVASGFYPERDPETNIQRFKEMPSEFYREKKALIEAYIFIRQFSDKGDLGFEHCNANLAMTGEEGNMKLVLLDSFYTFESERVHQGDSGLDD